MAAPFWIHFALPVTALICLKRKVLAMVHVEIIRINWDLGSSWLFFQFKVRTLHMHLTWVYEIMVESWKYKVEIYQTYHA